MNKIPNDLTEKLSSIQKVEFKDSTIIFYTNDGIFIYIPISCDKVIYSYLDQIGFDKYCVPTSYDNNYTLFKINSTIFTNPIPIFVDLYKKSMHSKSFSIDKKNKIFQRVKKQNLELMNYYHSLQDKIEEMYYPMNSYYQLLINISKIYKLLIIGDYFMNKWIESSDNSYIEVLVLKNIKTSNFIDNKVIDLSKSTRDYYIFELANYYQNNYLSDGIIDDILYFEDNFSMSVEDSKLFYGLISNVWKIDGDNIDEVKKLVQYVQKTLMFLSEKYEEDQKQEEDMLKEK